MKTDDVAIVKQAFAAFAARDLEGLEEICSEDAVVTNPPTGSAVGQQHYEGRGALGRYLTDVDLVWDRLELRPKTFHSSRPGEVLVAGFVFVQRGSARRELPAAWSWGVVEGKIASVRILPAEDVQDLVTPRQA